MITPNAGEQRSKIGLDQLYIALITQDDASGYVAGTPQPFAPAATVSQKPKSSFDIQYTDNQPYDVLTAEAETSLDVEVTGVDLATLATITGRSYDTTTGRMYDNGTLPPYVAFGFRTLKSTRKNRYYWFEKGKFSMPDEDAETLGEKPSPKTQKLTFTAIRTTHKFTIPDPANAGSTISDTVKRVVGDEDNPAFSATGWFSQVQTPESAAVSALALSTSDPLDNAMSVAVSKTITLTFNNALPTDATKRVVLVKADGTPVACTNSLDATQKIMTVNPDSDLAAASTYILAIAVIDIYGQTLNSAINFATA